MSFDEVGTSPISAVANDIAPSSAKNCGRTRCADNALSGRIAKWACLACSVLLVATIVVSHFRYIVFQAQPYVSTLMWNGRLGIGTSRLPGLAPRTSMYFLAKPIKPRGTLFPWFDSIVTKDGWNMLIVPLWLPLACMTVLTFVLFIHNRARRIEGLCRKCGYDLTGNESGVCPECGTPVA